MTETPNDDGDALLTIAERLARLAHAGQKERLTGDEYIRHVERVVAMVEGDDAKAVAWLHDVLEDCPAFDSKRLRDEGIPAHIVKPVEVLTRVEGQSYVQYIESIADSDDAIAMTVKRADLRDHLRPNCPPILRARYEAALGKLSIMS